MVDFWDYLDRLISESRLVIDRPSGSAHPAYPELIYPLDYGYLEGTSAIDGGGVDAWLGSLAAQRLDAVALTVDLQRRDAEIKLLLGCTEAEKQVVMDFLNGASMRAWLVRRDGDMALLRERRSVRHFLPRKVEREVLEGVLQAATWAPSAHNSQPWRFVVLESQEARNRLVDALGEDFRRDLLAGGLATGEVEKRVGRSRRRILDAPAAILLCLDEACCIETDRYAGAARSQAERLMAVQGVALAGGYLLLAAQAQGLGSVWLCAPLFAPAAVRQALDLAQGWQPQALILLGYPAREPAPRSRRPLDEVTRFL